jgi:hypothetical protein
MGLMRLMSSVGPNRTEGSAVIKGLRSHHSFEHERERPRRVFALPVRILVPTPFHLKQKSPGISPGHS